MLSDGCQERQKDAGTTARCLGLSRRSNHPHCEHCPCQEKGQWRDCWPVDERRQAGMWRPRNRQNEIRRRVHLEHPPDMRTKTPAPDGVTQTAGLFSHFCCYPGWSETKVSRMDMGQNVGPG